MSNWISVVVILGLIVVGVMVIHLVNGQHRNRIAGYSFGRSLWEPPNATRTESSGPAEPSGPAESAESAGPTDTGAGPPDTGTDRSHGLHRLSGLISGRDRRRRKAAR